MGCLIDVDPQPKNPDYNEISMIYDIAGNVPRKKQGTAAPAQAPAPQPAFQGQPGMPPQPAFQQAQAPQFAPQAQAAPPQQFAPQPQQFAPQNGQAPQQFQPNPNPPQFAQAGAPMPVAGKPAWAQ